MREAEFAWSSKGECWMDLAACHNHNYSLDWELLLESPIMEFLHDVVGIRDHINRSTGQLEGGFMPRYTRRKIND